MPTTDRDARALTYLARRLRDETHGACNWDEPGTYAAVAKLVGQNLASVVERVTRHAADPAAKTPGAISRPFIPDAQPDKWQPTRGPWCGICGVSVDSHGSDHEPEVAPDNKRPPDAMRAIVRDLRDRLEPLAEPAPARQPAPNPDGPAARARQAIAEESA